MLGTRTLLTSPSEAALFLQNNPTGLALVSSSEDEGFRRKATSLELATVEVGVVRGFNYSRGKNMVLRLYGIDTHQVTAQAGK
jgi:hypothetical protein